MRIDVNNGVVTLVAQTPADGARLYDLSVSLGIAFEIVGKTDCQLTLFPAASASPALTWRAEPPDAPGIWLARASNGFVRAWTYPDPNIPASGALLWAGPVVVEDSLKIIVPKAWEAKA